MNLNSSKHSHSSKQSYLSSKQVIALSESVKDMRDKLIIKILYEAGCSLGELVSIKVSDVLPDKIRIFDFKTKEKRFSKISKKLGKELLLYIQGNEISKDSHKGCSPVSDLQN